MMVTLDIFEAHRQLYADLVQKLLAQEAYVLDIGLKEKIPTNHGLYVITRNGVPSGPT
jgi:hypothetical protein